MGESSCKNSLSSLKIKEKIFSYIAENLSALLHVTVKLSSAIRSIGATWKRPI